MNKVELTPNTHKGKLIVFEGTDGAGKTTLINLTYKYLKDKYPNKEVILLKQPTDEECRPYPDSCACGRVEWLYALGVWHSGGVQRLAVGTLYRE